MAISLVCQDNVSVQCSADIARKYLSPHLADDEDCESMVLYITQNLHAESVQRLVEMLVEYDTGTTSDRSSAHFVKLPEAIDMFYSAHFLDLPISGMLAKSIFLLHVKDSAEEEIINKFGPHLAGFSATENSGYRSEEEESTRLPIRILNEHQWAFLLRYWTSSHMKAVCAISVCFPSLRILTSNTTTHQAQVRLCCSSDTELLCWFREISGVEDACGCSLEMARERARATELWLGAHW
jgi:hypothetical protein